ncbi:MAG: radical SAM family heme chaperone HemW [Flavobacteriaceae bacterium]
MAGIYLHIPFCKQACHYCNFHFSTSIKQKERMLLAMKKEIEMRQNELPKIPLESIYFGGGTPSLLSPEEITLLLESIARHYTIAEKAEITLEMNPDDFRVNYLEELKSAGINRLSIGVQSFFDDELEFMNRAHQAEDVFRLMQAVSKNFDNFSIDLIYGIPGSSVARWRENIDMALSYSPTHVSSYALTVEPKTVLAHQVKQGTIELLDETVVAQQFDVLVEVLMRNGYEHYELSNFGKPHFHSVNNSAYWEGKPYLGIGPSAHSFFKNQRSWNIQNNQKYMKGIETGFLQRETEQLSKIDQYNEYIMTGLRTSRGVSLEAIELRFGKNFSDLLEQQAEKHLFNQHLFWDGDVLKVTQKAKFLVDGIASDLFLIQF